MTNMLVLGKPKNNEVAMRIVVLQDEPESWVSFNATPCPWGMSDNGCAQLYLLPYLCSYGIVRRQAISISNFSL